MSRTNYLIMPCLMVLLFPLFLSCRQAPTEEEVASCIHSDLDIESIPFGLNVDPLLSEALNVSWDDIFRDIDYLRNSHPLRIRLTMRAHWMQKSVTYDSQGNPIVTYDEADDGSYGHVKAIYERVYGWNDGSTILAILYGTPSFNSEDGSNGPGVPIDVRIWQDFVRKMLTDFPKIDAWEIWNEPDLYSSFKGTTQEFGDLIFRPAYDLITELQINDLVLAPAWAQNRHSFGFVPTDEIPYPLFGWLGSTGEYAGQYGDLASYLDAIGGRSAFNLWAVHGYANFAESDAEWSATIQGYACDWDIWLQELMPGSTAIPLWITETGLDNKPVGGHTYAQAADFFTYFIQDQFLYYNEAVESTPYPGLPAKDPALLAMMYYELYDANLTSEEGTYMGLYYAVGHPKPIVERYRTLIDQFYSSENR